MIQSAKKTCKCHCNRKEYDEEIKNSGVNTLHIRGHELETNEVLVLAAITVPFFVAIVTTFWDRFSLEES